MSEATSPIPRRSWVTAGIVAVAVVLCLSALLLVGEARYRSCIARASARYPAVAVSAFSGSQTGPLKVSFVNERAAALDNCGRL